MARAPSAVLSAAALAVVLSGCLGPAATPSPSAVEPSPSTASPPSAGASTHPPATTHPAAESAPRCADAMVIDPQADSPVNRPSWPGDYGEQIAAADPRPGFEPAGLLESDGVLCSVVYDHPNDSDAISRISTALVRDPQLLDAIEAWALEHGYEGQDDGGQPILFALPGEPNRLAALLQVTVIGEEVYGTVPLEAYERRSGLDLEPTDIELVHADYGEPAD